jgi:hypothetical protein
VRLDEYVEVPVVLLEAGLKLPDGEVGADAGEDFLELEGLGDVVHAAGLEGLHLVAGIAEGTEEDDGDAAEDFVFLEAAAGLVAVHLGHVDVEQDEVGALALGGLEGKGATGDGRTRKPCSRRSPSSRRRLARVSSTMRMSGAYPGEEIMGCILLERARPWR